MWESERNSSFSQTHFHQLLFHVVSEHPVGRGGGGGGGGGEGERERERGREGGGREGDET